jgi:hypothetical protein
MLDELLKKEIDSFVNDAVMLTDTVSFSQYRLVKNLARIANKVYPSGNTDSQGRYKYWFDIITPRINDETKNIDLDTDNIRIYSEMGNDRFRVFVANALLREFMRDTQQGAQLNEDIEESTGWGNVIWKKVKGGKMRLNIPDVYVINQRARLLKETPVIERHVLTATELTSNEVWNREAVERILESGKGLSLNMEVEHEGYEIFERNGEMKLSDYLEARGESHNDDDEKVFITTRVIASLVVPDAVLFVGRLDSLEDVYCEYHRGRYCGRWFREGLYEGLSDIQVRCNEIGNEIARALEVAGKQIFTTDDQSAYENVMTDLLRGDIISVKNLQRVDMRFQDIGAFMTEWNNLMALADRISNSMEIVAAGDTPSNMPYRLGAMLNQNANKLYVFLREKFGLSISRMYEDWIMPDLLKSFRQRDLVRLTGDREYLDEYRRMVVDNLYASNQVAIGPHGPEEAEMIREAKVRQISGKREEFIRLEDGYWDDFLARIEIDPTGEGLNVNAKVDTFNSMVALETDPMRRAFLLDQIWAKLGVDTTKLPKASPVTQQMAVGTPSARRETLPDPQ